MKCPNCDKRVSSSVEECPKCGYEIGYMKTHTLRTANLRSSGAEVRKNDTPVRTQTQTKQMPVNPVGCLFKAIFMIVFFGVFALVGIGIIVDLVNDDTDDYFEYEEPVEDTYYDVDEHLLDQDQLLEEVGIFFYDYVNSLGTKYVFLEFHNGSEYDLYVDVDLELLDGEGNPIDTKYGSINAFPPGAVFMMPFLMDDAEDFQIYVYYEKEAFYTPVYDDLEVIHQTKDNEEIVTVRNNGDLPAEFVYGKVLFFKGDEVVGYSTDYFIDNDDELKPGQSRTQKLNPYTDYDTVNVYVYGTYYED